MKRSMKFILKNMEGLKGKYFFTVGVILLVALLTLISPMILSISIDSIIGGEPLKVLGFEVNLSNFDNLRTYLRDNLWVIALIIIGFFVIEGISHFIMKKNSAQISQKVAKRMREDLYDHVQKLPLSYHKNVETGDLIQRATTDINTIQMFVGGHVIELGRIIFLLIVSMTVMLFISPMLTLFSVFVYPFVILFSAIFFRLVRKQFKVVEESEAAMSTTLQENLSGVRVVRAFGMSEYEMEQFEQKNVDFRNKQVGMMKWFSFFWSFSDFLTYAQVVVMFGAGIYMVANGSITVGTFVLFMFYSEKIVWPVRQLGRLITDSGKTVIATNRLEEVLNEKPEQLLENKETPEIFGDITFDNVSFKFDDEERAILDGVSFNIKKGSTVAFFGPTGSGKSTILNLLLRLYDDKSGYIEINGRNIDTIDKQWIRKNIGIVLQEPFLYSRSIKENIAISNPALTEENIRSAASIASIHHVIEDKFDEGYETMVGEKGVTLSGGQKQRVAIARTIVSNPKVLVFDDSLSAVDTQTDQLIRSALKRERDDVTTIIVSHRITTAKEADQIFVLENGKITASGTHEELANQTGFYKQVWEIQSDLKNDEIIDVTTQEVE